MEESFTELLPGVVDWRSRSLSRYFFRGFMQVHYADFRVGSIVVLIGGRTLGSGRDDKIEGSCANKNSS